MLIIEEKYTEYFFALKAVFNLHRKYGFGKSPDIPSGYSESIGRYIYNLSRGENRTHDAISETGQRLEIKATGTKEGKTTISNSNEFDCIIWIHVDFDTNALNIYHLPRCLFALPGGKSRSSISLSKVVKDNNIDADVYVFQANICGA